MRLRPRAMHRHLPSPAEPEGDNEPLRTVRRTGDELVRAADEAIDRALSGDSTAFLAASRQQGGQ